MDKFVTVTKPSFGRTNIKKQSRQDSVKYNPYRKTSEEKKRTEEFLAPLLKNSCKPSAAALTRHLLNTLSDESNPITHSDIGERSDHVVSAATGHQRGEGSRRKGYYENRDAKLAEQKPVQQDAECKVLSGVRVYIDGYLSDTTDIEMKRIVTMAGGQIMHSAAAATHVVTSQQLSGSKTHKLLTTNSKVKVQLVKPEWVIDSIEAGKRRPEREYSIIKNVVMDSFVRS